MSDDDCDFRERFLADVCHALETTLTADPQLNLDKFRAANIFQPGCSITVTRSSTGKSVDAMFVDICDNWDLQFLGLFENSFMVSKKSSLRNKLIPGVFFFYTQISFSPHFYTNKDINMRSFVMCSGHRVFFGNSFR